MNRTAHTLAGASLMASGILVLTLGCVTTSGTTVSGSAGYGSKSARIAVLFSNHDRETIKTYYRDRRANLPPGLARKKELPPGLRKQVERKGHLPPGLQGEGLPRDLEKQLTALPDGHLRLRVGADIVLMEGKTRLILDVVKNVAL